MVIDSLYKDYFQKSKIFLYPILDIRRGACVIPEQTYLSWEGYIKTEDATLVALYPKRTDNEFLNFKKNVLLKHSRVSDYIDLNNTHIIITFDLSDMGDNYKFFLSGKYSKIDKDIKRKILNFFDKNSGNYVYVDSFLFPEKYFALYADLLNADINLLKEVGELCSPPNLEKENLIAEVIDLQNKKILG